MSFSMAIVNMGVYEACSVSVLEHCGVSTEGKRLPVWPGSLSIHCSQVSVSQHCSPAHWASDWLSRQQHFIETVSKENTAQGLWLLVNVFWKDVSYSGLSVRLDPTVNNAFPTCIMGAWIRIGENNSTMEQPLQGETI